MTVLILIMILMGSIPVLSLIFSRYFLVVLGPIWINVHLFQKSLSGPEATIKKLTTAKDFGNLLINCIYSWYLRSYPYER